MKIFAIVIVKNDTKPAPILSAEYDLVSFGFFQKSSVQQVMTFMAQTVAERTLAGQRQSVEEHEYTGHVYARAEGIAAVIIADKEYPTRPAFSLANKILDEFVAKVPQSVWSNPSAIQYPELKEYIVKYQDPKQADTIMRVQKDLDETKIILHKTIESVLARGEKLDSLLERSETLSQSTKAFAKAAKKTNSCCIVM